MPFGPAVDEQAAVVALGHEQSGARAEQRRQVDQRHRGVHVVAADADEVRPLR